MKSITAKQAGPLFTSAGMIGTVAQQIQSHDEMPYYARKQAQRVEHWIKKAVDEIEHHLSETTVRKMTRHGERFVALCADNGLVFKGMVEHAPTVCARLMAGHYALNHIVHKLRLKGPWRYADMTAGTLLGMIIDGGMGGYEAQCFNVAEWMEREMAA